MERVFFQKNYYVQFKHPLCNISVKSTTESTRRNSSGLIYPLCKAQSKSSTEGVWISNGAARLSYKICHISILHPYSPSIGLTNLAKPYHVHYHLSQPDMAGLPRLGRGATRRAPASVQGFALLADVRGNKACSTSICLKIMQISRWLWYRFFFSYQLRKVRYLHVVNVVLKIMRNLIFTQRYVSYFDFSLRWN